MTTSENAKGLPRRNFIQLGAAGLASALAPLEAAGESGGNPARQDPQNPTPPMEGITDPAKAPGESWVEPWTWRPEQWPGANLELNLVAGEGPDAPPSPGNRWPSLFSWNGISPAPTIRLGGESLLRMKVRNHLGLSQFAAPVGPAADPLDLPPDRREDICREVAKRAGEEPSDPPRCPVALHPESIAHVTGQATRAGHLGGEAVNGQHGAHVTNLHVHGLHTEPNLNANGSLGDDVMARIIPRADWEARQRETDPRDRMLHPPSA